MVNGGILLSPSLVKRNAASDPGRRVIQAKTSVMMRQLLRLNVVEGTGKNADVQGYEVGGKTGTAEKPSRGGYRQKALISSFVGMFPMNDPKFIVVVSLDEPKGTAETGGYATAGMVAAPSVKAIIENIASLYGILPGDLKQGLPPIEIASTPLPRTSAAAAVRAGERTPSRAGSSARRCRQGPARTRRRPHPQRECVALLLSELMRVSADANASLPLAARSGSCRPHSRLAQGQARFPVRRPCRARQADGASVRRRRGEARRGGDPRRLRRGPAAARPRHRRACATTNPRRRVALMAAAFAGLQPATIAAVTGTNGKTSTVHFVRHIWATLGLKAASVGTLGIVSPGFTRDAGLTTPDPVQLHADLATLAREGVTHLAIEASSHGLDQHRLDGFGSRPPAFTNLTHEHLDYHAVDGRLLRGQGAAVREPAAGRAAPPS